MIQVDEADSAELPAAVGARGDGLDPRMVCAFHSLASSNLLFAQRALDRMARAGQRILHRVRRGGSECGIGAAPMSVE